MWYCSKVNTQYMFVIGCIATLVALPLPLPLSCIFLPAIFLAGRQTCLVVWMSFMPLDRFAARLKKRLEKKYTTEKMLCYIYAN